MVQPPYILDQPRRETVLRSCQSVCEFRGWWLFVAHIRSNHAHLVLQANGEPEKVLNTLKSYASRALTVAKFEEKERRRWARHGSTRYLWTGEQLRGAIRYVLVMQGEPMSVYIAPDLWKFTDAASTGPNQTEPRP
jgi:REP element-mobilizing transposase RayT